MRAAQTSKDLAPAADYYLGRMARLEGNLDEAVRSLQEALALRPKFSEPHTELGRIALLHGEIETARLELEQALRYAPESFSKGQRAIADSLQENA